MSSVLSKSMKLILITWSSYTVVLRSGLSIDWLWSHLVRLLMHINVYYIIYTYMASGPITSWEIGGETVETVSDFILGGSKITADGDCSHEIKRHSLLGRKVMTNLDSIFKSRDVTLSIKIRLVKAMVFPVVMYQCESWTVKKAEHWRINAFELWCWRRLLRVLWTARRSNQSILKEISPGCSLEGMTLKLKLVLWPPHAKTWLIGKDSDAGRDWRREEKGTTKDEIAGWHHQLDGHEFE